MLPVCEGTYAGSDGSFPQYYKALVGVNIRDKSELERLGKSLSVPVHVVGQIECDGINLSEKAGMIITEWKKSQSSAGSEVAFRKHLAAYGLNHLLEPVDKAKLAAAEEERVLLAYVKYLKKETKYVDMVGASGSEGSQRSLRMLVDRVYVALRIERASSYERLQQAAQLDNEMKALFTSKNISWEKLSPDEKVHLITLYLSELPLSQSYNPVSEDDISDIPIAEAFKEHSALVVLGDPGSGKTTMVRWLALKLATAYLNNSSNVVVPRHQVYVTLPLNDKTEFDMGPVRVPVFVRISAFADYLQSCESVPRKAKYALLDFLGSKSHGSHLMNSIDDELFGESLNKRISELFFEGRITLILDGLDEVVVASVRRQVVDCVMKLIELCRDKSPSDPTSQVVVTSRVAGYFAAPLLQDVVVHGRVQAMSRQAIDRFVDCWMDAYYSGFSEKALQAAANLKKAIYNRDHPSVFIFASNPLLITLIAMIFTANKELPRERASLYEITFHYLVKTWREDCTKFSDDDQRFIEESLKRVAFDIHSTVQTGIIRKSDLLSKMMTTYYEIGSTSSKRSEAETYIVSMINKLQQSVGLLIERAADSFSFIHLSFEEFLAGCWLLRDSTKTTDMMLERLSDPRWREPILLAFGYASIKWSKVQFNALLSSMLSTSNKAGTVRDVVSLPALLVARSLPELHVDSVEDHVVDELLEVLITSFHVDFRSGCNSTTNVVKKSLRQLKNIPQCKVRLEAVLDRWLASGDVYKQCTVAALAADLRMMTIERHRKLCDLVTVDIAELGMPIHAALRHSSSPDVDQFFETGTAITTVDDLIDALLNRLKSDGDIYDDSVKTELETIRASYQSSNTLALSSKEAFFNDWKRLSKEWKDVADLSAAIVYQDLAPELGFYGDISGIQEQLQRGVCITKAAIGVSLNLYHELKVNSSKRECKPEQAALLSAAQMVNRFVRSRQNQVARDDDLGLFSDKSDPSLDSLIEGLLLQPHTDVESARLTFTSSVSAFFSSLLSGGMIGTEEVFEVLPKWFSVLTILMKAQKLTSEAVVNASWRPDGITTAAKWTSEAFANASGRPNDMTEFEPSIKTCLQACMDDSDVSSLSDLSTGEMKEAIPAIIVDGLHRLIEPTQSQLQRLSKAIDVLYESLDLIDKYDKALETINLLRATRSTYHKQRRICNDTYRQLADFRLAILPPRRDFSLFQSSVSSKSFISTLQLNPAPLKRICSNSGLFRIFVVLYGGISNLLYTEVLERDFKFRAFDQAPPAVRQHVRELQMSSLTANVSRDQFVQEQKHRKQTTKQHRLLELTKSVLRLSYSYRGCSSMDKHLKKALTSRCAAQTNALEFILEQACKALDLVEVHSSLLERCDACKTICAAGNVTVVTQFLLQLPFNFEVVASLAEFLVAHIEPTCREIQQLLASDHFVSWLYTDNSIEMVKSLLQLNNEFGGFVDPEKCFLLLEKSSRGQTKTLLEAEAIAAICCVPSQSDLCSAFWKKKETERVDAQQAVEAAEMILNVSQANGCRSWCRLQWLSVFAHPSSAICQYSGHPYTVDLLFSLMEICRKLPAQCNRILDSIAPTETDPEVSLLWRSFRVAVLTVEVSKSNWMNIPKLLQELETAVENVENLFIKGQVLITLATICNRKKCDLLQNVIAVCNKLVKIDASLSSQLLLWTLSVSSMSDFCSILEILEDHVYQISASLEKGMKLALVSSLRNGIRRNTIVCDALDALRQSDVDARLARVLRNMFCFVDACNSPEIRKRYNERLEGLSPNLAHIARGHTHHSIEGFKSFFNDSNVCNLLLLTARLRDCLADVQACFALSDERLLWEAISNGDKRTRELAKTKLKTKAKTSYLDLTNHSVLVLERLIECRDIFPVQILPYMRILELEVCCLLKKWVLDGNVGEQIIEKKSETKICDIANMLLAEQEGLNISNTDSIIKLLSCDIDVCRRRAEALLWPGYRLYHTALMEPQWLYKITKWYLDLQDENDIRRLIVYWFYKHVCHNDVEFYSNLLSREGDDAREVIIRHTLRVDEHVGELLLNSLTDRHLSSSLKRKLLLSLCNICYNYSSNFPSAAASLFQRLPDICRELASNSTEDLRSVLAYIGTPHIVLEKATDAVGDLTQTSDYSLSLRKLLATVNCSVFKTLSDAVEVLDRKNISSESIPHSSLISDFKRDHLEGDKTKHSTAQHSSDTLMSTEAGAFRRLLSSMIRRYWVSLDVAFDPGSSLASVLDSKNCNLKIVEVLADWSYRLLKRPSNDDMLFTSALLDDLLVCLAETSARVPAAFSNCVQQQRYEDLPHYLLGVARSNYTFPRRQAALMVLANLGKLTLDICHCVVSSLSDNLFVSTLVLKSVWRFVEADTEALQFLCEQLDSGSFVLVAVICRLLSALSANKKLSLSQRNLMFRKLNKFARELREDQPIILFRHDSKTFDHPSLAAVVGETVTSTWGLVVDDVLTVPFQLGHADGNGTYCYTVDETNPIWYRYCQPLNCWYWTPYENSSCWMPVSTLAVTRGFWIGQKPVTANQHCIRYLNLANPTPPAEIIDINRYWIPEQ